MKAHNLFKTIFFMGFVTSSLACTGQETPSTPTIQATMLHQSGLVGLSLARITRRHSSFGRHSVQMTSPLEMT